MFILIVIKPASALPSIALPILSVPDSRRYKILVVDDSSVQRVLCRGILREEYDVDVAEDAEQAMEMVRANQYDLILTDTHMPGKSGIELALDLDDLMRQLWGVGIPVVLMSDSDGVAADVHQALPRGVSVFVHKKNFTDHAPAIISELLSRAA